MRALRFDGSHAITLDLFAPLPEYENAEEYLIEICAVAITAEELDWWRRGLITALGHAFSGRIEASPPTSHFPPGTKVFGMLSIGGTSAAAEYIHAIEEQFATMPDHLTFEGAAAFPLAASVAWHSFLFAGFKSPTEVTIVGTNTPVGDMAVWLAQMREYRGWGIGP